jgi:Trypsin
MRTYWSSGVTAVWRVVLAMCALALTVCAVPGVAAANPAGLVSPQSLEVQTELDSSSGSVAEAKANLAVQHQASQVNLVGQLDEELGESYASVWFDNATGEFVVPVATAGDGRAATEASEGAVEEQFASADLESDYRTQVVKYSREELESAQQQLGEDLLRLSEEGVLQTAIDPVANAVEVRIPNGMAAATQAEVEAAIASASVHVELVSREESAFEASPDGCIETTRTCDLPVRGGEVMYSEEEFLNEGEVVNAICTLGFRANGYDGRKYILTAGHCAKKYEIPGGETLWAWFTVDSTGHRHSLGSFAQWHYPEKDWGKIDATGTWADSPPWPTQLAYWGSTYEYPVVGEARAYVGQTLCHVGVNTGTSCGIVVAENVAVTYRKGGVRQAHMTSLFEYEGKGLSQANGDSGGPVIANNVALGLVSGSAYASDEGGAIGYFSDITEATKELNVNIAGIGITEAITGDPLIIGLESATVSGQVDPHGMPTEFTVEWGQGTINHLTSYLYVGEGQGFVPVAKNITGLEPATTYKYRIAANNGLGEARGGEREFTTAPAAPFVMTEPAEALKRGAATLGGTVNPRGSQTTFQIEYGTTTSYGSYVVATPESVGAGRTAVKVRQALSGLKDATIYHFRIKASNAGGTTYSADATFKTPDKPVVTAEAASYLNTLEPQLNATVNPERSETKYQFEYGTTTSYGTKSPIPASSIGSSNPVKVEKGIKGLARNTTYHYRVTAENEVGVVSGADRSFTTLPPCKGAEAKCLWSLQEASNPAPSNRFELRGISCFSATSCVAVGKNLYNGRSFVDRWNGSSWSLFSGTVVGDMKHLSCVESGCFVAGTASGTATTWWVGEVLGLGWGVYPIAVPLPAGATETKLEDVDCTSSTACTAVGSYRASGGAYHPLVERWGSSGAWTLQSAPDPAEGTAQKAMLSVSCITAGCITVGEAAGKPVAETWMNGTWALSAPKLPAGAKGGKLTSISCTSSVCTAVGNYWETVGQEKALAESFALNAWSLMSIPNPAGSKGFVELAGISCPSATSCTAAGSYAAATSGGIPTELKTLVEAWNGSSWTVQSSANAAGQNYNVLMDVSCSAANACTAVGQDSAGFGQQPESLAERWNGTAWSTQAVVNPELPIETELKSVSCISNTLCVGVGKDLFAEGGFVEVWNGTSWMVAATFAGEMRKISCTAEGCVAVGVKGGTAETWLVFQLGGAWAVASKVPPLPSGGTQSSLSGVSCTTGSACTAVGSYRGGGSVYHPLVERWNGSTWSLQSAPDPTEGTAQNAMLAVSCGGPTSCWAVGEAAGKPVAEAWNGSAWASVTVPIPAGAKGATLAGISCGSANACMAVGASNEGAGTEKALAERWTGLNWAIVPSPTPAGAKGFVTLSDVACLSPNACFAAGSYAPEISGGVPVSMKTLAESWNGTEWTVPTTPNLPSQAFNGLAGVSCTTAINCTAVGGASSDLSKRPPVQVAMRFE